MTSHALMDYLSFFAFVIKSSMAVLFLSMAHCNSFLSVFLAMMRFWRRRVLISIVTNSSFVWYQFLSWHALKTFLRDCRNSGYHLVQCSNEPVSMELACPSWNIWANFWTVRSTRLSFLLIRKATIASFSVLSLSFSYCIWFCYLQPNRDSKTAES